MREIDALNEKLAKDWHTSIRSGLGDSPQVITLERIKELLNPPRGYANPNDRGDFALILATWQVDVLGAERITEWCKANGYSWIEVQRVQ